MSSSLGHHSLTRRLALWCQVGSAHCNAKNRAVSYCPHQRNHETETVSKQGAVVGAPPGLQSAHTLRNIFRTNDPDERTVTPPYKYEPSLSSCSVSAVPALARNTPFHFLRFFCFVFFLPVCWTDTLLLQHHFIIRGWACGLFSSNLLP